MGKMGFFIGIAVFLILLGLFFIFVPVVKQAPEYQYQETKELVTFVTEAADYIQQKGEGAFTEFEKEGGPWRYGNFYIFVFDTEGNMLVHPNPGLIGKNVIDLKDANGKPFIRVLIKEVIRRYRNKEGAWFHYFWNVPGSIFPKWKTSFMRLVVSPSGKKYVVGSGLYNMRMEKAFIVSLVDNAGELIEHEGRSAFTQLRDKAGDFIFMDAYVFVDTPDGVELVNPAFPDVEGKNLMGYKDSTGKFVVREYIGLALKKGKGWVSYLWPKPGEIAPSRKYSYVKKVKYRNETFIVGSGVYLTP